MELKERTRRFLEDTGAPVTALCKRLDISTTYYYKWMLNEVKFSSALIDRITNYLDEVYAKR